jgi:hypothetical protein
VKSSATCAIRLWLNSSHLECLHSRNSLSIHLVACLTGICRMVAWSGPTAAVREQPIATVRDGGRALFINGSFYEPGPLRLTGLLHRGA